MSQAAAVLHADDATGTWQRRAQPLLGTLVEIAWPATATQNDDAMVRGAFERIAQVHDVMSFHSPRSDLARIACAVPGTSVPISADTWTVLACALDLERQSAAIFNVAVAPHLVATGRLPQPAGASAARARTLDEGIELLAGGAVLIKAPVWIDLGGIAKGYAVDAAVDAMQRAGATAGLVNAGGDIRVFGAPTHTVHIRDPRGQRPPLGACLLHDGALATSSTDDIVLDVAALTREAVAWREHPSLWLSVTVTASSCMLADALTKVAARGPRYAQPLLSQHHANARWFDRSGQSLDA